MSPQLLMMSPAPPPRVTPVPRHDGPTRVLLAEDDDAFRDTLAKALRAEGYRVIEVTDGPALHDRLRRSFSQEGVEPPPDLVISGVHRSGDSGLDALTWLRAHAPTLPVILITASGDEDPNLETESLGTTTRRITSGDAAPRLETGSSGTTLDMSLDVDDLVFAATLLAEPR